MKNTKRHILTLTLLVALMTPLFLALDARPARAGQIKTEQMGDKDEPRKPKPKPGPRGEGDGD